MGANRRRGTRSWSDCGARRKAPPSVIDPLHEPLVASDVVIELAQQCVVEHDLPVLADDRLVPPRGFDLPTGDRVDRPAERARDGLWRAARPEGDVDRGRRGDELRHAGFGFQTTSSPKRSWILSSAAMTSSLDPSPPAHSLS